jgi:hypothetical protein
VVGLWAIAPGPPSDAQVLADRTPVPPSHAAKNLSSAKRRKRGESIGFFRNGINRLKKFENFLFRTLALFVAKVALV